MSRIFPQLKTKILLQKLVFLELFVFDITHYSQFCQFPYFSFDINKFSQFLFLIVVICMFDHFIFERSLISKFETSAILKFYCSKF